MSEYRKLTPFLHVRDFGTQQNYNFWCPGCQEPHGFIVRSNADRPQWKFDGNLEKPTFSPSLLYPDKKIRCHLFLKAGIIEFLTDCGHELRGQKVVMVPYPEYDTHG